jgi:putative Holliday junction resolvase
MSPLPRIAAVDVGRRRVGVAVADPLRLFARAVGTFAPPAALRELQAIHERDGIETVVVGWPLTEGGEEGEAVARTKPFITRLRRALPGVDVQVQDERYSTKRAQAALVAHGVGRKRRRKAEGRVDAAAAAIILQDWLEDHAEGGTAPAPGA